METTVFILSDEEYNNERYRIFAETGISPKEVLGEFEVGKKGTVYSRKYFVYEIEPGISEFRFYQKDKRRKKTFLSEGLKNGSLGLL